MTFFELLLFALTFDVAIGAATVGDDDDDDAEVTDDDDYDAEVTDDDDAEVTDDDDDSAAGVEGSAAVEGLIELSVAVGPLLLIAAEPDSLNVESFPSLPLIFSSPEMTTKGLEPLPAKALSLSSLQRLRTFLT